MKVGDKVVGVPCNERLREEHPEVVGYYDFETWDFGGPQKTEFVVVDGEAVDCDDIRPAKRRDKETVFSE